jgi:ABC-type multidrug transport system permease subunit
MGQLRTLYHLMRADFLERVRRYSFLVTMFVIVVVTYLYLPALDTPAWFYLNMGGSRPIYNSAWVGLAVAALMTEFFPLFGFYLVKNTLERDRRTGMGEIIATTPLSKPMYTLGKWLSNMAVFGAVIAVTFLTSLVLQFVRAEDFTVNLWQLAAPFLLLILPELAFVAALAVLFESINWLRGGFGNLVYYVVYAAAVLVGNLQGISSVWPSVYEACSASLTLCKAGRQIDLGGDPLINLATFRYEGIHWTTEIIWPRLAWIAISVGIALLASLFFHRFDPVKMGKTLFADLVGWIKPKVLAFVTEPGPAPSKEQDATAEPPTPGTVEVSTGEISWPVQTSLQHPATRTGGVALYGRMLAAELHLTFKGLSWLWYVIAAGVIASALFVPLNIAQLVVLPLAMVWPVLVWSSLGVKEVRHRTAPIVFASPYPLRRQLLITWLVGALIALVMASTVIVRLALAGEWAYGLAALIGALFVPSFAVALGCWSGTSKLFQAVYLFLWYLAAVQGVFYVDFMGHFPPAVALGIPWIVALVTVGLLIAAAFGRQRQIWL